MQAFGNHINNKRRNVHLFLYNDDDLLTETLVFIVDNNRGWLQCKHFTSDHRFKKLLPLPKQVINGSLKYFRIKRFGKVMVRTATQAFDMAFRPRPCG